MGSTLKKTSGTSAAAKKKAAKDAAGINDPRLAHMRTVLYAPPATPPAPLAEPPTQAQATAVSAAPAVRASNPATVQGQRETIERAWALLKAEEAVAVTEALKTKYVAMREANVALASADARLFEGTLGRDEVTLFPKRLRVPTETPPLAGWDYERNQNVAQ